MTGPRRRGLRRIVHGALFAIAAAVLRLLPRRRPRPGSPRRSLWAGTPIINMGINARAERLLGVDADSLVYETYYTTSEFTYDLSRWTRIPVLRTILPYVVLVWAGRRYDRFHFYCDRGLLGSPEPFQFDPRELRLLRRLGKQLFFWTYGADVRTTERTKALGPYNCCTDCPAPGRHCVCDESAGRRNHANIMACADAMFSLGDMTEYTPGSRTDLYFWPIDLDADEGRRFAPAYPDDATGRPLRIVHAANHRAFRGTRFIIDAVDRLRAEGQDVELVLVERKPNDEALRLYRSADVIFDNCLIGSYGFFGLEALALGKPVMAYIRRPDAYVLAGAECPIVNCHPERIKESIETLLAQRDRLGDIGRAGRQYVERHHALPAFAERLRRAYADLGAAS